MVARHDLPHMRAAARPTRMAPMLTLAFWLHVAGGSLALLSLVVPLVTKKGGTAHRRSGWVFVTGMGIVSVSALALAGARVLSPAPESRAIGIFLLYVTLLTVSSLSYGLRVLRAKKRTAAHRHPWDLGLPLALVLSSVAVSVWGWRGGQPVFGLFPVIGLLSGGAGLRYWLRPPTTPMHWWFAHMGGMLGGAIAAVTAFTVINGPRVGLWPIACWIGPPLIASPLVRLWTAYYERRFAGRGAGREAVSTTVAAG